MANIYYVDFSSVSNPGWEINSEGYPMGWTEFVAGPPGIYYCKGSHDNASEVVYLADKDVRPWSLLNFGPWRMNVNTITGTPSQSSNSWQINGGIINANNFIVQGAGAPRVYNFYNVNLILSQNFTVSSYLLQPVNINIKGSTLRCNHLGVEIATTPTTILNGLLIRDSIIVTNTNDNEGSEFRNSVFTASAIAWSNATTFDCQFDWSQPMWPIWSAPRDSWAYSVLAVAITIRATGDFVGYEEGLFGVSRSVIAGIGAFYFDVSNIRIYVTQRYNRHVIKRLDSNINPAIYDGRRYGIWSEIGRLRYPSGITTDGNQIYLSDYGNKRIVCLDFGLDFVTEMSTSQTVNLPRLIYYDPLTMDIYTLGITPNFWNMQMSRLHWDDVNKTLNTVKTSGYLGKMDDGKMPMGLTRGYTGAAFVVVGLGNDLFITYESANGFSSFQHQSIEGIKPTRYVGCIRHSNGDLYLNDGHKIVRVNFNYQNVGDSNYISKSIYGLKETHNRTMLVYNADAKSILRYDENLNFVEEIYQDSNVNDIEFDNIDVFDFLEVDLMSTEVLTPDWPRENAYGEGGYGTGSYGS